jgi:hypothetical protein
MLTDTLVTKPAKSSANPNARTMGHAVDAGSSVLGGMPVACELFSFSDAMLLYLPTI